MIFRRRSIPIATVQDIRDLTKCQQAVTKLLFKHRSITVVWQDMLNNLGEIPGDVILIQQNYLKQNHL